jgi:glycosyltransferase involved in cell wall biosynthesis
MKIIEIGTGYTSIPARMGAATEIVAEELSRSLMKLGQDVTIVDIKDNERLPNDLPITEVYMPKSFCSTDIKLGVLHKVKRVLYSISLAKKLQKLIKAQDGKIVLHFHNQYNLYFFLKLTRKSLRDKAIACYTVHSYVWFNPWEEIRETVKKRYFQEVYDCKHADRVFVLNDTITDTLATHCQVSRDKIVKVINGVNTEKYNDKAADGKAIAEIRAKYGLDGMRIAFQVGSVCERKNQLGTLKLLIPLMKKDKTLAMAYAGGIIDHEYADKIRQTAIENGVDSRVVYMGEVSPGKELNNLYSMSFVTFMNSQSEAFPLVIAESLSARRPVFVNEAIMSSLEFLVRKEGEGIIRITDNFEDDFMRLIADEDHYKNMQDKGREFIENEYSWNVAARQYLKSFEAKR